MSGEHRYHSAPASDEYRENFDRIFRGKRAGLNLEEIAFYDKYGYSECGFGLRITGGWEQNQSLPILR